MSRTKDFDVGQTKQVKMYCQNHRRMLMWSDYPRAANHLQSSQSVPIIWRCHWWRQMTGSPQPMGGWPVRGLCVKCWPLRRLWPISDYSAPIFSSSCLIIDQIRPDQPLKSTHGLTQNTYNHSTWLTMYVILLSNYSPPQSLAIAQYSMAIWHHAMVICSRLSLLFSTPWWFDTMLWWFAPVSRYCSVLHGDLTPCYGDLTPCYGDLLPSLAIV